MIQFHIETKYELDARHVFTGFFLLDLNYGFRLQIRILGLQKGTRSHISILNENMVHSAQSRNTSLT